MNYTDLVHAVGALLADANRQQLRHAQQIDAARALAQQGRAAEAVTAYQVILKTLKNDAGVWHELALLHLRVGDFEQATAGLIESIRLERWRTRAHIDFGLILSTRAANNEAVHRYLFALGAPDDSPGSLILAEAACRRTLPPDPSCDDYLRLAHLQAAALQLPQAIETFRAGVAAGYENAALAAGLAVVCAHLDRGRESHIWHGHANYFKEQYKGAEFWYLKALAAGPAEPVVHARLAAARAALRDFPGAIDACRVGIIHHPNDQVLACQMVDLLHADGQIEASTQAAATASARFPANRRLRASSLLSLPIVYEAPEDITRYRDAYATGLDALTSQLLLEDSASPPEPPCRIGANFLLAYQGRDDKALQIRFGRLLHHLARTDAPQWSHDLAMPPMAAGNRIRVGYVSAHLYRHTVGKLFLGWLEGRNRDRFEVFVYHLGARIDPVTQQYERAADHFQQVQGGFERICRQIIKDQVHILVYLDVGMDDLTTQLAAQRLAPVQCAAWGHPVTTGVPTIDYFISSDLMEPSGADRHYSETLIRLPGIGVRVPPPYLEAPRKRRPDFGLTDGDCVFLSPQAPFKYLPQHDHVFPRVAARVPRAKFVFLQAGSDNVTNLLKRRLLNAFAAHGLDGRAFLVFQPRQGYRDYLDLNCAADVFLDQPGWSGGMTALEALGCSLPVVTWPGPFMRGRHSFAFLRRMEIDSLIASDLDGFIDLAVRVGTDTAWRHELNEQIAAKRHLLFNDADCVPALEDFYSRIFAGMRGAA